jgi:hypothetical protein
LMDAMDPLFAIQQANVLRLEPVKLPSPDPLMRFNRIAQPPPAPLERNATRYEALCKSKLPLHSPNDPVTVLYQMNYKLEPSFARAVRKMLTPLWPTDAREKLAEAVRKPIRFRVSHYGSKYYGHAASVDIIGRG